MVATETRRLRSIFHRILVIGCASASASAACLAACSSSSSPPAAPGPDDASLANDAHAVDDATLADAPIDASDVSTMDDGPAWCDAGPPTPWSDAGGVCDTFLYVPCGLPDGAAPFQCNVLTQYLCDQMCAGYGDPFGCVVYSIACDDAGNPTDASVDGATPDSGIIVECKRCNSGRRPKGLRAPRVARTATVVGDFFARVSHLEAASIVAFDVLREDLTEHRAPRPLIAAARRAMREEARHARVTATLARAYGGVVPSVRAARRRSRSLEAIAIENVIEGCGGVTYAALVAEHQATHASDARISGAMARIAKDEARHAALSWSFARWANQRLDARARGRVARAQRRAIDALRQAVAAKVPDELVRIAGMPSASVARALVDALAVCVWA